MAISQTTTLSTLDDYARVMGLDMNGWNQTRLPTTPSGAACPHIWYQKPDLSTAETVGRDDVAVALDIAEDMIAHALGWKVARTWETAEEHQWPYPHNQVQVDYPTIQTDWGHVYSGGIKAKTLIAAGVTVAYSASVLGGVMDLCTMTLTAAQMTTAGATAKEIRVFFAGESDDAWEIRPLTIVENPTTHNITITGPSCRFVDPDLWYAASPVPVTLPIVAPPVADFVVTVDIYRVYNDTTTQGQVVWMGGVVCNQLACTEACQDACIVVDNPRLGLVRLTPASYTAATGWTPMCLTYADPTAVRLNYYAGMWKEYANAYRGDGRMQNDLAEAIVRLANTLLPDAPCSCGIIKQRWARDRQEKERIDSVDAALALAAFGSYMAGAIWAWGVIKRLRPLGRGASVRGV